MQQFTDKAKTALQLAAKAAKDLHQSYIGSEHLLVGLVREKTGVAAKVLQDNGVDEIQLISMIKDLIAPESNLAVLEREDIHQEQPVSWKTVTGRHKDTVIR